MTNNKKSTLKINIRDGIESDASFLAKTVMRAIGEDLCNDLGGGRENLRLVEELFTILASSSDSQYSYKNSLIAEDENGKRVGAVIAYDGAALHELRKAFIRGANEILGWNVTEEEAQRWGDETNEKEIYLDSLYVEPQFRKQGVASKLISKIAERFKDFRKPVGLLVEPENKNALKLYKSLGFKEVDMSHFFSVPMFHLQKVL